MPSPRKRRLKRAIAGAIGADDLSTVQKADAHFIEQLVMMHQYAEGKSGAPFVHGGAIKSIAPVSGLISDLSDLSMNATAKVMYDANPGAGEFIQFTDGEGLTEMFVFLAAGGGANGSEILTAEGKSHSPKRYKLDIGGNGDATITALAVELVKRLKISASYQGGAGNHAGELDLMQEIAGTVGNTSIVDGNLVGNVGTGAIEDNAADFLDDAGGNPGVKTHAAFGGGCSVMDATCKHYYANSSTGGNLTAAHGCLWLQNPMFTASALADDDAKLPGIGTLGNVTIDPAGTANGDRIHVKAVASGVSLQADLVAAAKTTINAAVHANMVASLAQGGGNVALGQVVVAHNETVVMNTGQASVANTADFLPHTALGCVIHWRLEDLTP